MSNILVIAEHFGGVLRKSTLSSITFARDLAQRTGGAFAIGVIGQGVGGVAGALAAYGAEKIVTVEGAAFANYLAQPFSAAVTQLVDQLGATFVVSTASTSGKDCLPRVAAAKGWGMVADCVGLDGDAGGLEYKRPMYAGNIVATVKVNTPGAIITVRSSVFEAAAPSGGASPVEAFAAEAGSVAARFVAFEGITSERPPLTEADVVAAGGRGLKDEGRFHSVMEPLADVLGGAIGATRAAVDSGFCPNDYQIGQTGKVVAPDLYIAVAISGAIQHLAGMKNSKCIVAINKDEEAPIFQVSDYGLVADAFKAVPEFIEKVKVIKG